MSEQQPRQVTLASGQSSGFGGRDTGHVIGLGMFLLAAMAIALLWQSLWGVVTAAALAGIGLLLFTPFDLLGGATLMGILLRDMRFRRRRHTGLAVFEPGEPARPRWGKAKGRARIVPDWLGVVRVVDVDVAAAGGAGEVCVLIHRPADGTAYATVALEVENGGGGVQSPADTDAEYARFGRAKARLARQESLVRVIQQIERVQPATAARHESWLSNVVPHTVDRVLVDSYANLLQRLTWNAETHRTVMVLRMPFSPAWQARILDQYGTSNDFTNAQLAVHEASAAAAVMVSTGGYRHCHPLSQRELAASIRACFSDAYGWDDTALAGPGEREVDLLSCWPAYTTQQGTVEVGGSRWLRTAEVVGSRLSADPVPVTMLRDLVVGIYPAMVRTISIIEELVPAGQARQRAKSDTTSRIASARAAGEVNDGSAADQLTGAQITLRDLKPSSGHGGDSWTAHITVSGNSEAELNRACARLHGVCADIGLPVRWMDKEQDLALATTLPIGRGLKTTTQNWRMR